MFTLRTVFRRPPRISIRPSRLNVGSRRQHDNHGPHKEYFQHPSQYPRDLHHPPSQPPVQDIAPFRPQEAPQPSRQTNAPRPSVARRSVRNSLLVILWFAAGLAAGTALVTWEYIQPPFERGSEEYAELQEEIEETLETAPICEDLRAQGWKEEAIIRPSVPNVEARGGDHHLMRDTLSGLQGVTMKVFRHPQNHATMVVFFAGLGLEGWPDALHGGAVASMLREAYEIHIDPALKSERLRTVLEHDTIAYTTPEVLLRPGEIYSVLTLTFGWGSAEVTYAEPTSQGAENTDPLGITAESISCLLTADQLPDFGMSPDGEGSPRFSMDGSKAILHATAHVLSVLASDRVVKHDGESREQYLRRLDEEARTVMMNVNKSANSTTWKGPPI